MSLRAVFASGKGTNGRDERREQETDGKDTLDQEEADLI
jgi:hypothetical protein